MLQPSAGMDYKLTTECYCRSAVAGAVVAATCTAALLVRRYLRRRPQAASSDASGCGIPADEEEKHALRDGAVTLRIVGVTDVYKLDNFPSLRTLILEQRADNRRGPTISMLTGDFLAPYLLSSIDKGRGMMTMLNKTCVAPVCSRELCVAGSVNRIADAVCLLQSD